MKNFTVTGMTCAACVNRIEKAVSQVAGVDSVAVSLLTNSMGVEGSASDADIIKAVEDAGYSASVKGAEKSSSSSAAADEEALKDRETPVLRKRLIASIGFLIVLMYVSMGHAMWGWPLPSFFHDNPIAVAVVQLILSGIIMVINQKFFISGFKGLIHRSPNMDTLVALGSMASFVWSLVVLFLMTGAVRDGDLMGAKHYLHDLYFESAAMILALITLGKMLEAMSKGRTTDALKGLMKLSPKSAVILRDGMEVEVPIEQVKAGDIFIVRPGMNVPVDGVVIEGSSAVNEAALTGESIPVDKEAGDKVYSATINQSGLIKCEATRVGEDTTLSQIIKMVSDAAATKAPIAKIADTVSGVFVPIVIAISIVTLIVWLLIGREFGFSLARAIAVLVISCPCALGLATPVAIMVGNGLGAKNGILFKTAVSLEETGKIQIIALDKTGTITKGEPVVTDLVPADGVTEDELLTLAYSLEKGSEHPLAKAVLKKGDELSVKARDIKDFKALPGNGLSCMVDDKELIGGSLKFISGMVKVTEEMTDKANALSDKGGTPLLFIYDNKLLGIISVSDTIKEDSPQAIKELKGMGIHVVMLTGDNARTAKAIADIAGVDEVIAGVLPDGKETVIRQLKEHGKVAMVGDGINDAPALTRADMGIAIGAGADVALDAADVVLMKNSLLDVAKAVRLSRATLRNIHENLFWAFIYNVIGIPLAAGCFVALGLTLNPMFGAAAMSLSSFCVVMNALRLNLCKVSDPSRDKKRENPVLGKKLFEVKEEEPVKEEPKQLITKIVGIEGMTCGHCEGTIKKALEAIDGIVSVEASHEKKCATVVMEKEVDEELIKKAIIDEDYEFIDIK